MVANRPTGPHHVFSYCWGGLVAYEIGLEFYRRGMSQPTLGIIEFGTEAAYQYASVVERTKDRIAGARLRIANRFKSLRDGESIAKSARSLLGKLSWQKKRAALTAKDFQFDPSVGDPKLIEHNVHLYFSYQIPKSNMNIDLFRTSQSTLIGVQYSNNAFAWGYLVGDNVKVHPVKGTHSDCVGQKHAAELASQLNELVNAKADQPVRTRLND